MEQSVICKLLFSLMSLLAVSNAFCGPFYLVVLVVLPLYTWAIVVLPQLAHIRPSRWICDVAMAQGCGVLCIYLASMLFATCIASSPFEEWGISAGAVNHSVFRSPPLRTIPQISFGFEPSIIPELLPSQVTGIRYGARYCADVVPVWPLVMASLCAGLALAPLRRKRIAAHLCTNCAYDMTGNTTGRCPECGTNKWGSSNRVN